jgi:hypothetical protein
VGACILVCLQGDRRAPSLCLRLAHQHGASSGARGHNGQSKAQTFSGHPPAVYMQFFLACPGDKPCTRIEDFLVDPVPKSCCILTVTNGDGRGTDEVTRDEVFLNGQRVLPTGKARNAQAAVKVLQDNTLKVALNWRTAFPSFHSGRVRSTRVEVIAVVAEKNQWRSSVSGRRRRGRIRGALDLRRPFASCKQSSASNLLTRYELDHAAP